MKTRFRQLTLGIYALTLLSGFSYNLQAATAYSSTGSGDWSNPLSWSVSGTGTPVIYTINTAHTITMDMDVWNVDEIIINGTLKLGVGQYLYMNKTGSILVNPTGSIKGGNARSGIYFDTACTIYIQGALMGKDLIDGGPRLANYHTMIAAGGDPQGSFPVILPVNLSTFSVESTENGYIAQFIALGESNQNRFEIETSIDGEHFASAGIIAGNGELSEGHYEINLGAMNRSFFVRLTEISDQYSEVLAVKHIMINPASSEGFALFPTVISDAGKALHLTCPQAGSYQVKLFGYNQQIYLATSIETMTDSESVIVDLHNTTLQSGIYIATVTGDNGSVFRSKIIVQ